MSAAMLREAAALMRERAAAATEVTGAGDWWLFLLGAEHEADYAVRSSGGLVGHAFAEEEASHIASWRPAVALAVADVLDALAQRVEDICGTTPTVEFGERVAESSLPGYSAALTLAAAYLGRTTPP